MACVCTCVCVCPCAAVVACLECGWVLTVCVCVCVCVRLQDLAMINRAVNRRMPHLSLGSSASTDLRATLELSHSSSLGACGVVAVIRLPLSSPAAGCVVCAREQFRLRPHHPGPPFDAVVCPQRKAALALAVFVGCSKATAPRNANHTPRRRKRSASSHSGSKLPALCSASV